jgi:outer membrane protein TolC
VRIAVLRPQLESGGDAVLRAARAAYAEGEMPLIEWLDAVRVSQDARSQLVSARADASMQLAALERAIGGALPEGDSQ